MAIEVLQRMPSNGQAFHRRYLSAWAIAVNRAEGSAR
jgi:hypothetical protein